MALSQRLDLRQTQSLVMTPQLQQAIKLLQLSNLEVAEFVEREIEQNPLLELGEPGADGHATDSTGPQADEAPSRPDDTLPDAHALATADTMAATATLDAEADSLWTDADAAEIADSGGESWTSLGQRSGGEHGGDDFGVEDRASSVGTLRDHLLAQIGIEFTSAADRIIGAGLVDLLDDAGYIAGSIDEVADSLGCPMTDVERVLAAVQRFEPSGVFARDLKECLAIQLRERNRLDPAMAALLDNLPMLAARDLGGLQKLCGVDSADLADMIAEIKTLNPKPALAFDSSVAQPVVPDVLMRPHPAGGWVVELNPESLPSVLVNQHYFARVNASAKTKADRDYLNERYAAANWLVKSLHQRATTILRVATEIVRKQHGFFVVGVPGLRPLILRDVAEEIGMHESTVSRVTANKYIATPRGVFELKYFFTTAIASATGDGAHSAEAVRYRIKSLIDGEKTEVLSDDRIVDILKSGGIDIARRTVAKYREAMRIPSSVQRRREKAIAGL